LCRLPPLLLLLPLLQSKTKAALCRTVEQEGGGPSAQQCDLDHNQKRRLMKSKLAKLISKAMAGDQKAAKEVKEIVDSYKGKSPAEMLEMAIKYESKDRKN
jgi:hypothetical protein